MEGEMHLNRQQSSTINGVAQLLQSGILKPKNLSDKVSDVEVSALNDSVNLSRSKRSKIKIGKKGNKKRGRKKSKWNTKENREKAREIGEEFLDDSDEEMSLEELNKELINSVKQSNLNKVEKYINEGADINTKDDLGKTPLHIAAKTDLLDIAKILLDKGADIDAQEKFGQVPLHLAAEKGHLDIVKYLVENGANVDAIQGGYSYNTALHYAARKGHLDIVKYLIEKGANADAIDSGGKTPLQRASEKGISHIVEYLQERTKERHQVATERQLVVTERQQVATERQLVATERQLVESATEEPQTTEDYSNISLHIAAERGNLNAVKYFVERGADVNEHNWYGGTPLKLAVDNGHLDVVRYLVEKGADVNAKDKFRNAKEWFPLYYAARKGHLDIVKCLLSNGADVNAKVDYDSSTALIEAANRGHVGVVEELLENNADIHAKDKYGYTPLHSAALNGYLVIVEMLIEKGADANNKNKYGDTPLDTARSRGFSELVKFLSSYQQGSRKRRNVISSDSWMNNNTVNWVKSFLPSSTGYPALLTSRGYGSTTVTSVPEINTTVANNTLLLGILAAGLFNKTHHKKPINENLLSPGEQSMRLNIDGDMIIRAIQKGEDKFGDPDTNMEKNEN